MISDDGNIVTMFFMSNCTSLIQPTDEKTEPKVKHAYSGLKRMALNGIILRMLRQRAMQAKVVLNKLNLMIF